MGNMLTHVPGTVRRHRVPGAAARHAALPRAAGRCVLDRRNTATPTIRRMGIHRRYSPYHNCRRDKPYPRVLFTTSTRDDRVHPGHARKTWPRMMEQGHDVLYYENIEGGHGGAAEQRTGGIHVRARLSVPVEDARAVARVRPTRDWRTLDSRVLQSDAAVARSARSMYSACAFSAAEGNSVP